MDGSITSPRRFPSGRSFRLHANLSTSWIRLGLVALLRRAAPKTWDDLEREPISIEWEKYMTDVLEADVEILPQMFAFGNLK